MVKAGLCKQVGLVGEVGKLGRLVLVAAVGWNGGVKKECEFKVGLSGFGLHYCASASAVICLRSTGDKVSSLTMSGRISLRK